MIFNEMLLLWDIMGCLIKYYNELQAKLQQ